MKIGVIADVHVHNPKRAGGATRSGVNERGELILHSLSVAVHQAESAGCHVLFVAGDLLDDDHPPAQLLARVQDIFGSTKMHIVLVRGNHETHSNEERDHSLDPLRSDHVHVVSVPSFTNLGGAIVECLPSGVDLAGGWYVKTPAGPGKHAGVVVVHCGIEDDKTPPWLRGKGIHVDKLFDVMRSQGLVATFAGDWHEHRVWVRDNMLIVQLGALVPTGWDNEGLDYGYVGVYDTLAEVTPYHEYMVYGPRFVSVRLGEPIPKQEENKLFVRVKCSPGEIAQAYTLFDTAKQLGDLRHYELELDTVEATIAARSAAMAARAAPTLDEALAGFVGEMSLAQGVDRARVLERARQYLRR